MGVALRGQGMQQRQLETILTADGALGFSAPGWGSKRLKKKLKKVLKNCQAGKGIDGKGEAETFEAPFGAVPPTNIMQTEGCMGVALRGQGM